jgi:sugar porter (SP) family MFS transporter
MRLFLPPSWTSCRVWICIAWCAHHSLELYDEGTHLTWSNLLLSLQDAVRTAYKALGDAQAAQVVEDTIQLRFEAQRVKEAVLQAQTAAGLLSALCQKGGTTVEKSLSAELLVTALNALSRQPDWRHVVSVDERFPQLLATLCACSSAMTGAQAADALDALARVGAVACDSTVVQHVIDAWLRRARTAPEAASLAGCLRALSALRKLRVQLTPDDATLVSGGVNLCLCGTRPYPTERVAALVDSSLGVGIAWRDIAATARAPLIHAVASKPPSSALASRLIRAVQASDGHRVDDTALLAALAQHVKSTTPAQASGSLPAAATGACRVLGLRRRRLRLPVACRAVSGDDSAKSVEEAIDWLATLRAFAVPALGGALFGYDIGISGNALVSLTGAASSGTVWGPLLSPLESGAVVSASLASAVAASAVALTIGDVIGRRAELLAAGTLFAAGASVMWFAPNYATLLVGRAAYGAGIGFAMHAAPIFIAETAPSSVRGTLVSAKEALIVSGILAGYLVGAAHIGDEAGWRTMFGVSALPAAAMMLSAFTMPESPRWLLSANAGERKEEAAAALRQLRGSVAPQSNVDAELLAMTTAVSAQSQEPSANGVAALLAPRNSRALYVGVSLMLFQQITGQPSVLYYATDIFRAAGFASVEEASQTSVVLGAFKLLMTLVATATVDKLGRRPLLLGGVSALTASLAVLAVLASEGEASSSNAYLSLACLLCYVGAYQVSFGPIAWLMVGEVFPAQVRAAATGVATITNFAANTAVSLALPLLQSSLGQGGTYALFAGLGAAAVTSIALTVPETKGKTLEEIEAAWGDKR